MMRLRPEVATDGRKVYREIDEKQILSSVYGIQLMIDTLTNCFAYFIFSSVLMFVRSVALCGSVKEGHGIGVQLFSSVFRPWWLRVCSGTRRRKQPDMETVVCVYVKS